MLNKNPEMNTKQWIMEGLARAFGMCITLKEEELGLPEKEIIKRLGKYDKDSVEYHKKELVKANQKMKRITKYTPRKWKSEFVEYKLKMENGNKQAILNMEEKERRHIPIVRDLQHILDSTETGETTKNIAKFGLQQLKLVSNDYKPYTTPFLENLDEYKNMILRSVGRDVKYHAEELAKADERGRERVQSYKELRSDLDKLFGDNKQ